MRSLSIFAILLPILWMSPTFVNAKTSSSESSQPERLNELRIQVQDGIPIDIVRSFSHIVLDLFSLKHSENLERTTIPPIGLYYQRHLTKRSSLGVGLSFMYRSERNRVTSNLSHVTEIEYGSQSIFFVNPRYEYIYLQRGALRLYTNVSIGFLVGFGLDEIEGGESRSSVFAMLDVQYNPIGIRVGKQIAGFAEFGAGFKGIFTLGLSAEF